VTPTPEAYSRIETQGTNSSQTAGLTLSKILNDSTRNFSLFGFLLALNNGPIPKPGFIPARVLVISV
jgi:hypothetical protein